MSLLFVLSTWAAAGGRKKGAKQTITKMRKVRSTSVVRSAAFVGFCFVFYIMEASVQPGNVYSPLQRSSGLGV